MITEKSDWVLPVITGKAAAVIVVLSFALILQACSIFEEKREPEFIVHGDQNILEKMVINVESDINDKKYPGYPVLKVQTSMYKGKQYSFQNDYSISYNIYFSYENKVGKIRFDNIEWRDSDHINHIYVYNDNGAIYITYYGTEDGIQKKLGFKSDAVVSLEDYFKKYNISDQEERNNYQEKFFNFFEPATQEYRLPPLDKGIREHYKTLSLEDKKKYNLPDEYIKQAGLPDDELRELLEHSQKKVRN